LNIGIYIFDQAEVLDFSGPFEVFSTAARICENDTPFHTFLISQDGTSVNARGNFQITPAYGFHNAPDLNALIIAGGVIDKEITKKQVIQWIQEKATGAVVVASVCTGVFLLAEAGVVTRHRVTTHWEDRADLKARYPRLNVEGSKRWVADENIITSAGISAGIDMSLHLVTILYSKTLAQQTAKQMEYHWNKDPGKLRSKNQEKNR